MVKTYHFHDLETGCLNPAFDQILQFAVARTNEPLPADQQTPLTGLEHYQQPRADLLETTP